MAAKTGGAFLTGVESLDAKLRDLPLSLQKKGARKATRRAAKAVLGKAVELAPVRTGALKKSLTVRAKKRSRVAKYKDDVGHVVQNRSEMFKGDQFYGGFMEFGTDERETKQGHNRGKIVANKFDFMRRAMYLCRSQMHGAFVDEITSWINSLGENKPVL